MFPLLEHYVFYVLYRISILKFCLRHNYWTTFLVSGSQNTTWSETYFRQDLFPAYLFFRRLFHAIVIFRFKSISDLDSGSIPRFFGEFIYAKLKIVVSLQRLNVKWQEIRSPVDRVRVRARVRLGLVSNSDSSGSLFLSIFMPHEHWPKYADFISCV